MQSLRPTVVQLWSHSRSSSSSSLARTVDPTAAATSWIQRLTRHNYASISSSSISSPRLVIRSSSSTRALGRSVSLHHRHHHHDLTCRNALGTVHWSIWSSSSSCSSLVSSSTTNISSALRLVSSQQSQSTRMSPLTNPVLSASSLQSTATTAASIRCLSSQVPNNNNNKNDPYHLTRPPTPPPSPPPSQRPPNRGLGLLGTGASAAVVLFGKTKYIFAALKLTKLASLGSMLVTVGAYSMVFGWPYAVGMVGLILVHETGHALVMLQRGIPFSPMVFVPFMGAAVAMKQQPRDAYEDALVAFGGPVLGSLGAAAVGVAGQTMDSQLLIALADFGFMINLFNLLPIGSMDGGRIGGALSPWMNVAGLAGGVGLAYTGAIHNPVFYLILLAGGYETFMKFYDPASYIPPNYYNITPMQRAAIGIGYIGLVASLAIAMDLNEKYKKPPEQIAREQGIEKTWDMR